MTFAPVAKALKRLWNVFLFFFLLFD